MKKSFLLGVIILLLVTSLYAADYAKIDNTIYVDKLGSTEKIVKEIDNTDTLEFLAGKEGYKIDVIAIKPDSIELKLLETGETITVNLKDKFSFSLQDGTKLFVKYLEFETKEAKISLWLEGDNVETAETSKTSEDTAEESTKINEEEEITGINTEEKTSVKTKDFFTSKDYTTWIVTGAVIVLIIVVGLIIYFNRKDGGLVQ